MRVGELSRRHFSSVAESVCTLLLTLLNIPYTEKEGCEKRNFKRGREKNRSVKNYSNSLQFTSKRLSAALLAEAGMDGT